MGVGPLLADGLSDAFGVGLEDLRDFGDGEGTLVVDLYVGQRVPLMIASTLGIKNQDINIIRRVR